MKRKIILIVIIILLTIVGLSGCSGIGETKISDIMEDSSSYVGKTVTIRGVCRSFSSTLEYKIYDTSNNKIRIYAMNLRDVVRPSKIYSGTTYKFTGIIRVADDPTTDMFTDMEDYLEVSKIETT